MKKYLFLLAAFTLAACAIKDKEEERKAKMKQAQNEYALQNKKAHETILPGTIDKMMFVYEKGMDCKYGEGHYFVVNAQNDTLRVNTYMLFTEDCDSVITISNNKIIII
ncbi:MAG: hypothetical protein MJZ69_09040 [Bacteroidaceae bacterium]|nr:hypothetical protein [Candidatus Minthousia equi]MCQ2246910.1 hypothetical protein [Bacteroidaceae bacterium]